MNDTRSGAAIFGIDGNDGSGKSTSLLVSLLVWAELYGVAFAKKGLSNWVKIVDEAGIKPE